MEDLFKKLFYTGVGLAAATTDKFQQSINKLVEDEKIHHDEGKKIVDDFMKSTEGKKGEYESKFKEAVSSVVEKLRLPSKADFEALEARIAELESAKPAKSTVAKAKAATK